MLHSQQAELLPLDGGESCAVDEDVLLFFDMWVLGARDKSGYGISDEGKSSYMFEGWRVRTRPHRYKHREVVVLAIGLDGLDHQIRHSTFSSKDFFRTQDTHW